MEQLFQKRLEKLFFYSPYHFLREISPDQQIEKIVRPLFFDFAQKPDHQLIKIDMGGKDFFFFLIFLAWDSHFFQIPTYKLFSVLYDPANHSDLGKALSELLANLRQKQPKFYFWAEIPAEDTEVAQAISKVGFGLVETRLHFVKKNLQDFDYEPFAVRKATEADIPNLRKVAAEARNPYDRVHADTFFGQEKADQYLALYAENAVKGFAETVLVPADSAPPDSFLAISSLEALQKKFARIALTAVLPSRKGWHLKLCAETIQYAQKNKADYVLMTTQATNGAVFRTTEKLGFQLGACSHIFSYIF